MTGWSFDDHAGVGQVEHGGDAGNTGDRGRGGAERPVQVAAVAGQPDDEVHGGGDGGEEDELVHGRILATGSRAA